MKQPLDLDGLSRKLLAELQKDASLTNAELAERVGSTAPSCWRRVRAMEEAGILKAAVRLVDQQRLGPNVNVLCHVRLRGHSRENSTAFEQLVLEESRIMECHSMSGEWDYLLRVVARDVADYESFLMGTVLACPAVGGTASQFSLRVVKYGTALPV
jgi:DNA-binding Lrp family transcriptional regulator